MEFLEIANGIHLVGTFGPFKDKVRMFLLRNGLECAVVELPPIDNKKDPNPWELVSEYIKKHNLTLRFITASHGHWDHFYIYPEFHQCFPTVPIIISAGFLEKQIVQFITARDLKPNFRVKPSIYKKNVPLYCFNERIFETHLAGEPLYLIKTPKHSWGDISIIFKGAMITGDWWLGPGDPNPNRIPLKEVNASLDALITFASDKNYQIHTLIAAHDNDFRSNVNFLELLETTRP